MSDSEKGSNNEIKENKQDLVIQLIKKFSLLFENLFKNQHLKDQLKFSKINELELVLKELMPTSLPLIGIIDGN